MRAFHAAALAAGYEDHGMPGERAVYHPGYYGVLVLDPERGGSEAEAQARLESCPRASRLVRASLWRRLPGRAVRLGQALSGI